MSVPNIDFYLSNSKLSKYFFSISFSRKIIILKRSLNLLKLVLTNLLKSNDRKIVVIYYHAECHFLARIVGPLFNRSSRIVSVIYLCQSPKIYPQKLLYHTIKTMRDSKIVMCYSKTVAELWRSIEPIVIYSIYSPINIKRLGEAEKYPTQMFKGINLVHVGRDVAYKSPEKSLEFALRVAKIAYNVNLTYIGINNFSKFANYDIPRNLKIQFLGLVPNSLKISRDATAMLNFANFDLTGEVIGIGALESLALGVPVIVNSLEDTGYSQLPGIITADNFINQLEQKNSTDILFTSKIKMSQKEISKVREELSLDLYYEKITALIGNLGAPSTINKLGKLV
jgi:glycosyltransferase involved in cell wall biosynthesis